MVPPPVSKKPMLTGDPETDKKVRRMSKRAPMTVAERLLKGSLLFCMVCFQVPIAMLCLYL
jgi:E3 ubiquitin-protein ligase UHRF1